MRKSLITVALAAAALAATGLSAPAAEKLKIGLIGQILSMSFYVKGVDDRVPGK
jgi:ABC-type sugar transport system substrate-binding protein